MPVADYGMSELFDRNKEAAAAALRVTMQHTPSRTPFVVVDPGNVVHAVLLLGGRSALTTKCVVFHSLASGS